MADLEKLQIIIDGYSRNCIDNQYVIPKGILLILVSYIQAHYKWKGFNNENITISSDEGNKITQCFFDKSFNDYNKYSITLEKITQNGTMFEAVEFSLIPDNNQNSLLLHSMTRYQTERSHDIIIFEIELYPGIPYISVDILDSNRNSLSRKCIKDANFPYTFGVTVNTAGTTSINILKQDIDFDFGSLKYYGSEYEIKCNDTWAYYNGYVIDYSESDGKLSVIYPNGSKGMQKVNVRDVRKIPALPNYNKWRPKVGDTIECKAKTDTHDPFGWWRCKVVSKLNDVRNIYIFIVYFGDISFLMAYIIYYIMNFKEL